MNSMTLSEKPWDTVKGNTVETKVVVDTILKDTYDLGGVSSWTGHKEVKRRSSERFRYP